MSLLMAELFISLSDQHTTLAKTYNDIADELSEAAALSHPAVTGEVEVAEEPKGLEGADAKVAENQAAADEKAEAADKKKAAAAKRRAAAKAKKEAAEAEAAEAEAAEPEELSDDDLLALGQKLAGEYMDLTSIKDARTILLKHDVRKVSEATGDADTLKAIAASFTEALAGLAA